MCGCAQHAAAAAAAAADDDDDDVDDNADKDVLAVDDGELRVYGRAATLHPHIEVIDVQTSMLPL